MSKKACLGLERPHVRVGQQQHAANRGEDGQHIGQAGVRPGERVGAPFAEAQGQHEQGRQAMLESLGAELPERRRAERPLPSLAAPRR